MQPTKNSTQLEKLKVELQLFLSAPCYNEELSQADENVKKFVKAMKNFVKVHTEAFITLCEAENFVAAHHFVRLLTDCLETTFAATILEGEQFTRYIKKFLDGKEPKDTRYKGKRLNTTYLRELMKQSGIDMEVWRNLGNESTHPKAFYQLKNTDFTQQEIDDFSGFMRYPLSAIAAQIYKLIQLSPFTFQ